MSVATLRIFKSNVIYNKAHTTSIWNSGNHEYRFLRVSDSRSLTTIDVQPSQSCRAIEENGSGILIWSRKFFEPNFAIAEQNCLAIFTFSQLHHVFAVPKWAQLHTNQASTAWTFFKWSDIRWLSTVQLTGYNFCSILSSFLWLFKFIESDMT